MGIKENKTLEKTEGAIKKVQSRVTNRRRAKKSKKKEKKKTKTTPNIIIKGQQHRSHWKN
jgi:hypothetical protein